VFELLWLLLTAVLAWVRPRNDLVLENLLLRHQLAVLTRPTRTRRRARLRAWDKVLWVLARRFCAGWRQLIEVTPWGQKPRHLRRDRDAIYGRDFRRQAGRIGIDAIATPVRAPKANAIAERVIETLSAERPDHLIVLNEQHLTSVLTEFVRYYNQDRPHRTLGLQTPEEKPRPVTGPICSRLVLNGLHHVYERAA
jgi:transposase InsO family protein